MGYLFLGIALLVGATKGFCGKKMSGYVQNTLDLMFISTFRMLVCVLIGFGFILISQGSFTAFAIDEKMFWIAFLAGISTAVFVVAWLLAVKKGAYVMLEVFVTLGVLIPLLLCNLFFGEKILWIKWVGVALLILAAYIMCSYNNSIHKKLDGKGLAILLTASFANGLTQFSMKWFSYQNAQNLTLNQPAVSAETFNFYTYIMAFFVLSVCWTIVKMATKKKKLKSGAETLSEVAPKQSSFSILKNDWYFVLVMALCLFLCSYFTTLAGSYLPSSELYPLQQGLSLFLSVLMSAIFFKEKITKKCILGVIITFVALLIINVLPSFL